MEASLADKEPDLEIECPEFDADEDDDPLFDSLRDYIEQIDAYKAFQNKPTARKVRQREGQADARSAERQRSR